MKIKHILFFCFLQSLILNFQYSFGQGGTWTWISGDSTQGSVGVFGTQGMPSVNNHPHGIYEGTEWKDKQGNFWIYGGVNGSGIMYSDLWKYNPVTNEWTWIKGNGVANLPAIYGTKGLPNAANTPGGRGFTSASWVDTSGNLWLFGGLNPVVLNWLNDLWEYNISTNNWTWTSGDSIQNAGGVHGIQGVPSPSNVPGTRDETCSAWTDSLNNLWLFGGEGFDDNDKIGILNDLCKYDIAANEWTWMKGAALKNYPVNYGIKKIPNPSNDPGARFTHTKWKDLNDNFWIMGGFSEDSLGDYSLNDVWKYDKGVNVWTWMYDLNIPNYSGIYQNTCVFDTLNMPYTRFEQRSSVTDSHGRFWLFGGAYNLGLSFFNDLWVFDPLQLKWNWLSGTNAFNQAGNYGALGVPLLSNIPPSRFGAVAWWSNDNKFYLFGGSQSGTINCYCDLWVFNPDTNCVSGVVPPPVANFQSSQTIFCANNCINFTDLSTNANSWQWLFAGATDSISTLQNPQNVCYITSGKYNVTLIASNAAGSDTVIISNYINVSPAPPTPVIIQRRDTLYCTTDTSYSSYQWYLDSAIINGATDTTLIVSKNGNYNLRVTNENGCQIAVGITVIIGIQSYMNDNTVSLYPDPVGNKFTVHGLRFTVLHVEIYNVLGLVCQQSDPARAGTNPQSEIDVSDLPSGIYFVQVANESRRWVGKFVKE